MIDRLGVGGQGEVWLAFDPQVDRLLAVKIVRPSQKQSPTAIEKIRREARITALLQHPNVVPVYDTGYELTASGEPDLQSPCFMMRAFGDSRLYTALRAFHSKSRSESQFRLITALKCFSENGTDSNRIELQNCISAFEFDETDASDCELKSSVDQIIKCASEAGSLSTAIKDFHSKDWRLTDLRLLITRFERVCDGVAYAHSKGVFHLDLKPDNIILGEFGETLVADWGLAKEVGRSDTTQDSFQGTLLYMSPEQANGESANLGATSDIYSLGAVLYCLLTGIDAIGAQPRRTNDSPKLSSKEICDRVIRGEFPSPQQINPKVPKPLEKIVLKAMSCLPSDRYPTVIEMAEDIRRWQIGDPVTAWSEPSYVKGKRFVREHQDAFLAGAATLAGSAAILLVMFFLVRFQKIELSAALERVEHERNQAAFAQRMVEVNAQHASKQSSLMLEVLRSVVLDLQKSLRNVAGGTAVRNRLLATALPQLEKIATEYIDQVEVDRTTMLTMLELADTIIRLGRNIDEPIGGMEAYIGTGTISSTKSLDSLAERVYQRANEIAQKLHTANPDSLESQRDLWQSLNGMGLVSQHVGKSEKAVTYFKNALKMIRSAVEREPKAELLQFDLSKSLESLSGSEWRMGNLNAAIDHMREARTIAQLVLEKEPDNASHKLSIASLSEQLSFLLRRAGKSDEALQLLRDSLQVRESSTESLSVDAEMQRGLSIALLRIGELLASMNSADEAYEKIARGAKLSRQLAIEDPLNQQKQRDLVLALERYGDLLQRLNRSEDALDIYTESKLISERATQMNPADSDAQRNLGISCERIGMMLVKLGKAEESHKYFTLTLEIYEKLLVNDKNSRLYQGDVARAHANLGSALLELGKSDDAMKSFQASLTLIRDIVKHDTSVVSKRDLSIALERIGDQLISGYEAKESVAYLQESLAIRRQLANEDPRNAGAQHDLHNSLCNLGDALSQLQKHDEALEMYRESLAISKKNVEEDEKNQLIQRSLSSSLNRVAEGLLATGDKAAALEHSQAALLIARSLAAADQNDLQKQSDLSFALNRVGDFLVQNDRTSDALECFREGMKYSVAIAAADAKSADRQHDLMYSYYKLAETLLVDGQYEQARCHFALATTVLEKMIADNQAVENSIAEKQFIESRVNACNDTELATSDLARIFDEDEMKIPDLLLLRMRHFGKLGQLGEVAAVGEKFRNLVPHRVDNFYNAACAYCICSSLATKVAPESAESTQNHFIKLSIECLNEAVALGFDKFGLARQDEDLAPILKLPEFVELIPDL